MFNKEQCVSLNYLIEELIYADISFRFVAPIEGPDSIKLHWQSDPDQVAVVSRIVNKAIELDCAVLIGTVDAQEDKNAYYVGFDVDPTVIFGA